MAASSTHRAIDAVWRIELAKLIAIRSPAITRGSQPIPAARCRRALRLCDHEGGGSGNRRSDFARDRVAGPEAFEQAESGAVHLMSEGLVEETTGPRSHGLLDAVRTAGSPATCMRRTTWRARACVPQALPESGG